MVNPELSVADEVVAGGPWTGPVHVRAGENESLEAWIAGHGSALNDILLRAGAARFTGFGVESPDRFRGAAELLCGPLLDYLYRSTPRTTVNKHVYTATEYRADAAIPMHNENAYQRDWPMRLVFGCLEPAAEGGETPLALTASVTRRIDPAIRRTFAEKGVMYVRNYGHGVDLPWQTVFQTESRAEVESYCRRASIEFEWLPDDRLRTRQVCAALARHPDTHEELWFNQAHLFHVSSLGPEGQQELLELFGEPDLPRHAYFGDGGRIDEEMLAAIRQAYDAEAFTFPWHKGDVLLLDNMLVAHSRRPYRGRRQVLVAMAYPFSSRNAGEAR